MHMSASIQGRWLSLIGRDERPVTGWQWTVTTGLAWTINVDGWNSEVDAALAHVALSLSLDPPAFLGFGAGRDAEMPSWC
jgi:hypothetical protein